MILCFECSQPAEHNHHVVPKSQGGKRTIPLCVTCHGKAHAREMAHPELTKKGIHKRKAAGLRYGNIPHGRRLGEDDKLERDEMGELAVETARRMRNSGVTLRQIARHLQECGMLNQRGKAWNPASIFKMATRP